MTCRAPAGTHVLLAVTAWLALTVAAGAADEWHPGKPGAPMQEFTHNADAAHRRITWAEHAGFTIAVDAVAVYDGRGRRDHAPRVRVGLAGEPLDLAERDFAVTAQVRLSQQRGRESHAGIYIEFGGGRMLVFGPGGAGDLALLWSATGDGVTARCPGLTPYVKVKRRGTDYSAWASRDGATWEHTKTVTIAEKPVAAGAVLMNWGTPHAEAVGFRHLEITHVENEPDRYVPNVMYGGTDETALHFIYNLSGVDILVRVMARKPFGGRSNPFNRKVYVIHGSGHDEDGPYYAVNVFRHICEDLIEHKKQAYHRAAALIVAPRFPRGPHPYPGRSGFSYQRLRGAEDRILMDLHEDFVRERFPADRASMDDKFALLGHSGGAQFAGRFLMAHADKLYRAVLSSPATYAFPTITMEWPLGLKMPDECRFNNPRLALDRDAAFDLPVGVIVGSNDNLTDRGTEEERYRPVPLAYSRLDGARKWVRQMAGVSRGRCEADLHVCPRVGHGFAWPKRMVALTLLFGTRRDRDTIANWQYTFDLGQADQEQSVAGARVPERLLSYFKFNRFRMPDGRRFERYEFRPDGTCLVTDQDGNVTATTDWSVEHDGPRLRLTVRDKTYLQTTVFYGKLRIYTADLRYMLEQSPVVTPLFVQEQVVGRWLHLYRGHDRNRKGPHALPSAYGPLQLNADGTVTHAGTTRPYAHRTMQRWQYDNAKHLLYFSDREGKNADPCQLGQWRWGFRPDGQVFLAGLSSMDLHGNPRMELQTDPEYNRRYFEEWDTGPETWQGLKERDAQQ